MTETTCFHGGAFFAAVGDRFDDLDRRHAIVNADVLDAWFPPAPGVLAAIGDHLEWLARTSPPASCAGLQAAIAEARGVDPACILPGAGSSSLIYLALRAWLGPRSRAIVLDPCYGEYAHVLEHVVGCHVDRFPLRRSEGWAPDLDALAAALDRGYDLLVLVNPNNPTGHHVPRDAVIRLVDAAPPRTRVWIDEAYLEYVAPGQSLEHEAAHRDRVVVCKSMSKVYALSGMRAAYLCGAPRTIEPLRALTPPWAVGLPSQVAAVRALADPAYYAARYEETLTLRAALEDALRAVPGIEHVAGGANFVLCHLDPAGPRAAALIDACRAEGIFLRDVASMARPGRLGAHAFRVAVKDALPNALVVSAIRHALAVAPHDDRGLPRHAPMAASRPVG